MCDIKNNKSSQIAEGGSALLRTGNVNLSPNACDVMTASSSSVSQSTSRLTHRLRKDYKCSLIGNITNQIIGAKLPSNRQVLSVLFFNIRTVKLSIKESATLVVKEVLIFWEKGRIPTKRIDHCVEKVISLHKEWQDLQKRLNRESDVEARKRKEFLDKLDDLFDIAHENALNIIKIEEDKQFLLMQRKKGRPGSMAGTDRKFKVSAERKQERIDRETERRKRTYEEIEQNVTTQFSSLSSSDSENEENSQHSNNPADAQTDPSDVVTESEPSASIVRGTLDFFTPRLSEALDRCKISDRNAVYLLMAAAEAFNYNKEKLIINRTSFQRRRTVFRLQRQAEIRDKFNLADCNALVLHWDGKLLPALCGVQMVDRLAILVTFHGKEQLLGLPEIQTSAGEDQALAAYQAVQKWGLEDKIQALCCDTTPSNTGRINGACTILEKMFHRDLLYLPCRHHIYELVLRSAFDTVMSATSGPDIQLFKRFRETWSTIDKTKYRNGIQHVSKDVCVSMLEFLQQQLCQKQHRDDYQELLELAVMFLGGAPERGVSFRMPGAVSHARWMAKAIYAFKIYLFQEQFKLSKKESDSIRRICIFLIHVYLRGWFLSPFPEKAPYLDYNFLLRLINYKQMDPEISSAAVKKFTNHLWYLSPEPAAFAFFDDEVPIHMKQKLAAIMMTTEDCDEENQIKRYIVKNDDIHHLKEKDFSHFICAESKTFFSRFSISTDFLTHCPSTWKDDINFQRGLQIVKSIVVVNDVAERGVKLIQEYQNILSKDEEEKQCILQIVSDHRKKYPHATKSGLMKQ